MTREHIRTRFAAGDFLMPLAKTWSVFEGPTFSGLRRRMKRRLKSGEIPLFRISNRQYAFATDLARVVGAASRFVV
jgi:hypothetical protein